MFGASRRAVWVVLGWLSLVIGVVGIFLPILPTAPFVILAAFCFSRGSERMHQWLLRQPYMGDMIRHWREHGAIPVYGKIACAIAMTASAVGIWLSSRIPLGAQISVSVFLVSVLTYVLSRPSQASRPSRARD